MPSIRNPLPVHSILRDIRAIEFEQIRYDNEGDDYFEVIEGNIPILLSAPHGARHLRQGTWKGEDEYTSSLAIKLGELTGAFVIFVKNKTEEDSNWLPHTRYKDAIRQVVHERGIGFLADIHGADIRRNYKVTVGIIDEKAMERCSCPGSSRSSKIPSVPSNTRSFISMPLPPRFLRP